MSPDDRLLWLSIALVGGVAALGTFGALLTVIRFLHDAAEK